MADYRLKVNFKCKLDDNTKRNHIQSIREDVGWIDVAQSETILDKER